jgi:hypothetical protein
MNINILKKLAKRVQFTKLPKTNEYQVKAKNFEGEWIIKISTTNLTKAIQMKHNLWMLGIRDLGYRVRLIDRRKSRQRKKNKK